MDREIRPSFSLIELLVVAAVMMVLLALIMPALGQARTVSYRTVCASNLQQVALAFAMYQADYNDIFPGRDDGAQPWLWMGRAWRGALIPYIAPDITKDNPSILWCPADPTEPHKYENTSYAYSMSFYHSPEQIDRMTNQTFCYSNPVPAVAVQSDDVAFPARKILAGEWFSNHRPADGENGWWAWVGARNFLFPDGHAEFIFANDILPANDNLPDTNLTRRGHNGIDK